MKPQSSEPRERGAKRGRFSGACRTEAVESVSSGVDDFASGSTWDYDARGRALTRLRPNSDILRAPVGWLTRRPSTETFDMAAIARPARWIFVDSCLKYVRLYMVRFSATVSAGGGSAATPSSSLRRYPPCVEAEVG